MNNSVSQHWPLRFHQTVCTNQARHCWCCTPTAHLCIFFYSCMFICVSAWIIPANASHFPGQTKLFNAVSFDYANYRNDKGFLFFLFFFLDPNVLKNCCKAKIRFCLLTKRKPRSWITFESTSPPHCSALDASVQHISLHFLPMRVSICTFGLSTACTWSVPPNYFPLSWNTTIVSALNFPELVNYERYKIFKCSIVEQLGKFCNQAKLKRFTCK